jgi:heme-degrading monooxygenase HmoA
MIYEQAQFRIRPGTAVEFEAALLRARTVIAQARGFVSIEHSRGIERPDVYHLRVVWQSVDDHVHGFRESELFTAWRAIVGPFFDGEPIVEHVEPCTEPYTG